eukprot:597256-Pyramimonas_sp.AAC.1
MGGELNSSVVERLVKGLTGSSRLRRFLLGVRESLGEELSGKKVLLRALCSVWSPSGYGQTPTRRSPPKLRLGKGGWRKLRSTSLGWRINVKEEV